MEKEQGLKREREADEREEGEEEQECKKREVKG